MKKKSRVGFLVVVVVSFALLVAIAVGIVKVYYIGRDYTSSLQNCRQVVEILEVKEDANESIIRGLKIEYEKCNKRYRECESFRQVVRDLPVGNEIEFEKIIPLPDVKGE